MSPYELERAVAQATGETRREVRRRGFQLVAAEDMADEASEGAVVDWDAVEAERLVVFP
ncbi:MAG: hypothetical protein JNL96_01995 [Planctomycetaceae bacterium]|nr:hypothetical protein [Planctomycetaceae bacterium]